MFEGSLVESRGLIVSPAKHWTAAGSAIVQCAIAALLIAMPLTHPQLPPLHTETPRLLAPTPVKPPIVRVEADASPSSAMSVPAAVEATRWAETKPGVLSRPDFNGSEPGPAITGIPMGDERNMGASLLAAGAATMASAVPARPAKKGGAVAISSGVSAGMLLEPIRPVYPAIAKAARLQGVVVMEAVISRTGRIESLRATSGPPMLRQAALEAVQAARYRPYELNGQATEVQTTITVNFRLAD